MSTSRRDFIRRHTQLRRPPAVPELRLYLADEIFPLWRTLDAESGPGEESPPFWAFAWAGGQALARYLLDHPAEVGANGCSISPPVRASARWLR